MGTRGSHRSVVSRAFHSTPSGAHIAAGLRIKLLSCGVEAYESSLVAVDIGSQFLYPNTIPTSFLPPGVHEHWILVKDGAGLASPLFCP